MMHFDQNSAVIKRHLPISLVALLALLTVTAAQAQRSSRPSENPLPTFEAQARPSSQGLANEFRLPPLPPSAPSPAAPRVQLRGFEFQGNSVFSDEALMAVAAPFLEGAISSADLEELRHRLTRLYVVNGYVNSGALLPDQRLDDGIVTYQLIEGRLARIEVNGADGLRPSYIEGRLAHAAGEPLNVESLRSGYQALLRDPLIKSMKGRLGPGVELGSSVLSVEVERDDPYEGRITLDNHRTPSTGSLGIRASLIARNLTGWGDQLDLSIGASEGGEEIGIGFQQPLTHRGTKLALRYSENDASIIEESLEDLDIESRSRGLQVGLSHPLDLSRGRTLTLGATLALRENQTELGAFGGTQLVDGADRNGESRIAVLRLRQEYLERATNRVFGARSTFSIGTDLFNATPSRELADDDETDSRFLSWLGQLQYARRLPIDSLWGGGQLSRLFDEARLLLRGDLQLAADQLVSLEDFAVGGANSVRGYRQNELVRDQGYVASAELQLPFKGGEQGIGALSLALFSDIGAAWEKGERGDGERLHSIGLGLNWRPSEQIEAELMLAHDLKPSSEKEDYDPQDSGIHFRLSLHAF